MMHTDAANFFETLDTQDGIQDGISFAYTFGVEDISQDRVLQQVQGKSDAYVNGFTQGFDLIKKATGGHVQPDD